MKNNLKNTGKILFLHGLEAGLNGNKSVYLRKEFPNCTTPDFQVSRFKIWLKNSFLRHIITTPIFLITTSSIFLSYFLIRIFTDKILYCMLIVIGLFVIFGLSAKNYLIRIAVIKSLENNIEISHKEIMKSRPEVIIGSSWGGAILVKLIERGMWKGNSILIAPAYYSVNKIIYNNRKEEISKFHLREIKKNNFNGKIIIYHSKEDNIVPLKDSIMLCDNVYNNYYNNDNRFVSDNNIDSKINDVNDIDIDLKINEKGDHSMNVLLEEPENILKNDILEMLNFNNSNFSNNNEKDLIRGYNNNNDNIIGISDNYDKKMKEELLLNEKI